MKSKTKYKLLKVLGVVLDITIIFVITAICAALKFDELWKSIDGNGLSFGWVTLILYRLTIYLLPGIILSFIIFDKRYKYVSRLKIWLNWTLCVYLVTNAIIRVFAIDKAFGFEIFNNLDVVVLLTGYVITFVTKEKVSFDSTEAIINPKSSN